MNQGNVEQLKITTTEEWLVDAILDLLAADVKA
jgi:hypothetical protein